MIALPSLANHEPAGVSLSNIVNDEMPVAIPVKLNEPTRVGPEAPKPVKLPKAIPLISPGTLQPAAAMIEQSSPSREKAGSVGKAGSNIKSPLYLNMPMS